MMPSKKFGNQGGYVYSTDPGFHKGGEEREESVVLPAPSQKLKIRLDTKNRAGKAVTLVEGFAGPVSECGELGKKLKNFCGTGGSVKDGQIILQGDQRDKILKWLLQNGYASAKKI
jgi:translation initiation factor 1